MQSLLSSPTLIKCPHSYDTVGTGASVAKHKTWQGERNDDSGGEDGGVGGALSSISVEEGAGRNAQACCDILGAGVTAGSAIGLALLSRFGRGHSHVGVRSAEDVVG